MELPSVLITNLYLRGRSGTETYTRDLSMELKRRGATVAVFSPDREGPIVPELRGVGIPVVQDPRDCPFNPDLIHGNHNFAMAMAIQAFPSSAAIFVCHDAIAWHDRAPRFPQIVGYFAVDAYCQQRVASDLKCEPSQVKIVGNSVDLNRFQQRSLPNDRPQSALIMNHMASETTFVPVVRRACERMGIQLTVIGAHSNNVSESPETELPKYDLVFAKGRSAMEAMCCGCAVILCGVEGVGPLVKSDSFAELRKWNFGRRTLSRPHEEDLIITSIAEFDQNHVLAVTDIARQELALTGIIDRWLDHYNRLPQPVAISTESTTWVDEFRHIYELLDHLHTLEYQNNWYKQNWKD